MINPNNKPVAILTKTILASMESVIPDFKTEFLSPAQQSDDNAENTGLDETFNYGDPSLSESPV